MIRTKASSEYLHAKRRALERYQLQLTKDAYLKLCERIQKGDAAFVERQSNRLTKWKLAIDSKECVVIYDNKRHRIVTFLPGLDTHGPKAI